MPPIFTLPPEGIYSDIERDLIDNEPPGLFPDDQTSLWGQVRKVFGDELQVNFADKLAAWYLNLDPRTVGVDDMPEWEEMLAIPGIPHGVDTTRTEDQRRAMILSRREQGVFTTSRIKRVVESFIKATFGPATQFTPDGLVLDASGLTMFSGSDSLAGTYTVRQARDNMILNGDFETDLSGWFKLGATDSMTRVTTQHFYGAASLKYAWAAPVSGPGFASFMPINVNLSAGEHITYSGMVKGEGSAIGKTVRFIAQEWGGAAAPVDTQATAVLTGSWQLVHVMHVVVENDREAMDYQVNLDLHSPGDVIYVDGLVAEMGDDVKSFIDSSTYGPFYYEVRILDTIDLDIDGLTRELDRITPSGISFNIVPTATP